MANHKHPYLVAVGNRIRNLRLTRTNCTQENFAYRIGFDRSRYGKAERGEANLTIISLTIIANGLGVEVRDLLPDFESSTHGSTSITDTDKKVKS